MTSDFISSTEDPNGVLSPEDLRWSQYVACIPFNRCNIEPTLVVRNKCQSMVCGEMGNKRYLIYGRVTHSKDSERETGPMPHVLIDTAIEIKAEPHVVRINVEDVGKAVVLNYWGINEMTRELKSNVAAWRNTLLKNKSCVNFFKMNGNKADVLSIDITKSEQQLCLTLKVNGDDLGAVINIIDLVNSVRGNDKFWIFTCDCGEPGCASIWSPVTIVCQKKWVVWKNRSLKPKRVYIFDEFQYRVEVLHKCKEVMTAIEHGVQPNNRSIYLSDPEYLKQALQEANVRVADETYYFRPEDGRLVYSRKPDTENRQDE